MSITSRCNLACPYCHREGDEESPAAAEMPLSTVKRILRAASLIGISHLKITGGEPLLRDDLCEIVAFARSLGISDISLTTNGILLAGKAQELRCAGLSRLNIGCDSLSSSVSGKNRNAILPGLIAAREAGFENVKVNMVVLRGVNESEIDKMIEFARENKVILQLIELIPTSDDFYRNYYVSLAPVEEHLKSIAKTSRIRELQGRRQYDLDGVTVEIVRPFHEMFCEKCVRIRVTSSGMIKPCLMRGDNLVPFSGVSSLLEAISHRRIYDGRDDRHLLKNACAADCTRIR
jgi:cyclic pyranopterin phosphate synthase